MKKPEYCPEWFDIDAYDDLADLPRNGLSMALWMRKMNYKGYCSDIERFERGEVSERNGGTNTTPEQIKAYAIEWLSMLATKWLAPPENKNSQAKEDYDPLEAEQDIIREFCLGDVVNLFAEFYLVNPQMRRIFQQASVRMDRAIRLEYQDYLTDIVVMTEEENPIPESDLDTPLSEVSDYADIFIINLAQSDEVLKMAFEQKLKEIRAKESKSKLSTYWSGRRTKRYTDAEIRKIVEYRVFAYIDLYVYGQITGRKFTDVEMAAMIYPPRDNTPLDFDAVGRIARTVKPKAIELLERTNPRLLL